MGERDLYRNHATIMHREERIKEAEMEKTRLFFETKKYSGIPVPTMKQQNKDHFGQNTEDKLDEWEKNQVKEVFQKYDADMKQGVTKEELFTIMDGLMKDECIIGKIPNLEQDEISILFEKWEATEEAKYSW